MASEIWCCRQCGRDTTNKTRICSRCYGNKQGDEMRGRKARSSQILGGDPNRPAGDEEWWDQTAAEEYHGESPRDDL
jgi:predicted amidophosphoribosyltransferase